LNVDTAVPDALLTFVGYDDVLSVRDPIQEEVEEIVDGSTIDDSVILFAGTVNLEEAAKGSQVMLYLEYEGTAEKTPYGPVDVDPNTGEWSHYIADFATNRTYTVSATVVDLAGNESAPKDLGFKVDTSKADDVSVHRVEDNYRNPGGGIELVKNFQAPLGEEPSFEAAPESVTNDKTFTIVGSGPEDARVRLYVAAEGSELVQDENGNYRPSKLDIIGTVESNGVWSYTMPEDSGIEDGTYQIWADAISADGKEYDMTGPFQIILDTTAAEAPTTFVGTSTVDDGELQIIAGSTISDLTPTFSGDVEPRATVNVYYTDQNTGEQILLGSTEADRLGQWRYTASLPESQPGVAVDYSITITQTDLAGNEESGHSPSLDFTVELPAETNTLVVTDNLGDLVGVIGTGGTTDDPSPILSGKVAPNVTVKVYYTNDDTGAEGLLGEATADASGSWEMNNVRLDGEIGVDVNYSLRFTTTAQGSNEESERSEPVSFKLNAAFDFGVTPTAGDANTEQAAEQQGAGTKQAAEKQAPDVVDVSLADSDENENSVYIGAEAGERTGVDIEATGMEEGVSANYSLSADSNELFSIDADTGMVTLSREAVAEDEGSHELMVLVQLSDGSSHEQALTVDVKAPVYGKSDNLLDDNQGFNALAAQTYVLTTTLAMAVAEQESQQTGTVEIQNAAGEVVASEAFTLSSGGELAVELAYEAEDSASYSVVVNYNDGADPVEVNDLAVAGVNPDNLITPLVLDLDGDGTETLSLQSGVDFDIDADGKLDRTAWVGADDGLLVRDIDGDGQIDDGSELFGAATRSADGGTAEDGFAALAELDSNRDGVVDADDEQFGELQVWRDGNSDGRVQEGELLTMEQADVTSISLTAEVSDEQDNGNIIGLQSSYERSDGSSLSADDVWFAYEPGAEAGELDASDILDLAAENDAELPLPEGGSVELLSSDGNAAVDVAQVDAAMAEVEQLKLEMVCLVDDHS
ncbi:MAG: Ig-like domain-containing protein, partial [Cellvibrionaceae bacterium]|nr:Ig-like domain-containing protein [Cellvibrionaceae bacterium]